MNALERGFQGAIVCRGYSRTWAFPKEVAALIERETSSMSVLHLFGGQAKFGTRLDADRSMKPHVVGNAFYPPFRCGSFDAVVLDPPYTPAFRVVESCMIPALCIARRFVWWFATWGVGGHGDGQRIRRWWAVLPSENASLRILAELERVRHPAACHNLSRLPGQAQRYDWHSFDHPSLFEGVRDV